MNEIIVGNIGSVYYGSDDKIAQEKYIEYVSQSKSNYGRAGGEDVTWLQKRSYGQEWEIHKEFIGQLARD